MDTKTALNEYYAKRERKVMLIETIAFVAMTSGFACVFLMLSAY